MASTTFVDQQTTILASWLNDVNLATYTTLPAVITTVTGKLTASSNLSDVANATTARANLNAQVAGSYAASGANSDITSLASPALAAATATTQASSDNSTKVATTAMVQSVVALIQGVPPGTRISFTGTSAPAGYLVCPIAQTNISRTTYPALHALYASQGYPWGTGDGSTTFGMPWYPADYAPVQSSGNVGTSTLGQIPAHTHSLPNCAVTAVGASVAYSGYVNAISTVTGSTGTGTATLAAGVRELFCVKY